MPSSSPLGFAIHSSFDKTSSATIGSSSSFRRWLSARVTAWRRWLTAFVILFFD
ncbi:hypothetical protein Hanom_Chr01g00016631 [Helianthus anomalus]